MKRVLFTPVGLTDPISNFRDGAMLNICRFCNIDKVYIYLSKEVYGYHKHDNRYIYCLEKLAKNMNKKIEYEIIVREKLEDVHLFDFFIDEFRSILKNIYKENITSKIYLNVSSGTPAMKSALQILAAFREIEMTPVQVSTPEGKSNPHAEEKINYCPEQMWECNEDNVNSKNRCTISKNINFLSQIKKKMISELINKYDYIGAKTLADSMKDLLSPKFMKLLDAACMRLRLDYTNANNTFREYNFKLLEHTQSNVAAISEYLLFLDLKVRKGELADFLRAITPILADLFELILKDCFNFDVNNYVYTDKNNIRKWDKIKLSNTPE
ncbi:MAG: type III-A CRISPR-associated CARF protein Csm6, partial [Lachnospirales bacterium]